MKQKMVFLGGGNMAEALLQGILRSKIVAPADVVVTDIRHERLDDLEQRFGVQGTTDNAAALVGATEVWLCVKPQQMTELLRPLAGIAPSALYISIAAGVPTAKIEAALGGVARVVRVMPNTPALVGEGAAGVAAGAHATSVDCERVCALMRCVGQASMVAEDGLHAVTALSGSGPAYVFYLVEAMLRAASGLDTDAAQAREWVVQTIIGAGKLLQASPDDTPETLRLRVTSKGGTTAAAIAAFDAQGVSEGLVNGVLAAAARSRELAAGA